MTPDVGTAELTQVGGTWLLALAGEQEKTSIPDVWHNPCNEKVPWLLIEVTS